MVRRRWWVLAAWLVAAVALSALSASQTDAFRDVFTIPNTNSQEATDLLNERFPAQQDPTAQVVFAGPSALSAPATQASIEQSLAAMAQLPSVASVSNPFDPPARVSESGTIAVATVRYTGSIADVPKDAFEQLEAAAQLATKAKVVVEFGGPVVDIQNQGSQNYLPELIGLGAAIIVLLFVFGIVLAAFLPLGVALFGVTVAGGALTLLATQFTIGTVAPVLGKMIGLGVGIDYSLLILSRYLQNRDEGMDHETGVGRAVGTAGAASLFAGCCVAMALCGLALAGVPYVATLGFSAGVFVVFMVIAALTLLPALLGFAGPRITRKHQAKARPDAQQGFWYRFAHAISKRAWLALVGSIAVLVILAAPMLDLKLGFTDDGDEPTSLTQRRAYDLITKGFGEGANGPLLIAIGLPAPTAANAAPDLDAVEKLLASIAKVPNVASVTPPLPAPTGDAAVAVVTPSSAPNAAATQELVRTLRASVIPAATAGTPIANQVFVGGQAAVLIDVTDRVSDRLIPTIAAVVLAAFLLLMIVFRSVLVPLTAALMNLVSIGAAYGVIVAVFQWGWGRELIGVHQAVPVIAFIPLMMFAILFGLSMDYEVFLLSRIREEYLASGDSREAVAIGLAKTARVITSAALIMIAVFLAFVLSPVPTVKMMGIGMAAAVLVDATLVRLLLVPASMELLGKANWWLPRWLDRILPHLNIDGGPSPVVAVQPSATRLMVEGAGSSSSPALAASSERHASADA